MCGMVISTEWYFWIPIYITTRDGPRDLGLLFFFCVPQMMGKIRPPWGSHNHRLGGWWFESTKIHESSGNVWFVWEGAGDTKPQNVPFMIGQKRKGGWNPLTSSCLQAIFRRHSWMVASKKISLPECLSTCDRHRSYSRLLGVAA